MNSFWFLGCGFTWALIGVGCWLGWHLLRQNGGFLVRLEELEGWLDDLEFAEPDEETSHPSTLNSQPDNQSLVIPQSGTGTRNGNDGSDRFSNRSVARSRIKRDGLKTGTSAPEFLLPSLDGTERSLR